MNENKEKLYDTYRSFLLMSEIAKDEKLSQRELAKRLGVALGLVNSYLKNLLAKGYIRVKAFPKNRYGYLLTPQGMAEKTRLAYQHMTYFTNLYRVTREDYKTLFSALEKKGIHKVAFCGVDEVAEIAYLSMRETVVEMVCVMDDLLEGNDFFGKIIVNLPVGLLTGNYPIVLTSLKKGAFLERELIRLGVDLKRIHLIGQPLRTADSGFATDSVGRR